MDITVNAQDDRWMDEWFPEKGAVIRPYILGENWEREGDSRKIYCGLFVLDDPSFRDTPSAWQLGGVAKPSDTDFSDLDREIIWKNTTIRRIGETIAARYGLGFSYDADDYEIEDSEQDGSDGSYYNTLEEERLALDQRLSRFIGRDEAPDEADR